MSERYGICPSCAGSGCQACLGDGYDGNAFTKSELEFEHVWERDYQAFQGGKSTRFRSPESIQREEDFYRNPKRTPALEAAVRAFTKARNHERIKSWILKQKLKAAEESRQKHLSNSRTVSLSQASFADSPSTTVNTGLGVSPSPAQAMGVTIAMLKLSLPLDFVSISLHEKESNESSKSLSKALTYTMP